MVSIGAGGIVLTLENLASGIGKRPPTPGDVLSFGNTSRSFASAFLPLPSSKVFSHTPPVVIRAKNYSAYDIPEFLAAVGFSEDEVAHYRMRALPFMVNFRALIMPMTCINAQLIGTIHVVL
ncbi:hypothetical protein BAE44_0000248 [Dichanthelium oligosanthes]|uniref:Uncharacterized protein n=1 Tax=Dichanthelium oligosanthes TaxID=888268 RepID=A0A1E5WMZ7_9POAL|nr:hypothetical protein BAE44_0000248 [Dichanthelium oligosanthes]